MALLLERAKTAMHTQLGKNHHGSRIEVLLKQCNHDNPMGGYTGPQDLLLAVQDINPRQVRTNLGTG